MGVLIEHKADPADHGSVFVAQRQARDHQRLLANLHDVDHDGSPALDNFAHQAVRYHGFHGFANGVFRAVDAEPARISVAHPDDACLFVDHQHAVEKPCHLAEKRRLRLLTQRLGLG